jgi:hypothetical protein
MLINEFHEAPRTKKEHAPNIQNFSHARDAKMGGGRFVRRGNRIITT